MKTSTDSKGRGDVPISVHRQTRENVRRIARARRWNLKVAVDEAVKYFMASHPDCQVDPTNN